MWRGVDCVHSRSSVIQQMHRAHNSLCYIKVCEFILKAALFPLFKRSNAFYSVPPFVSLLWFVYNLCVWVGDVGVVPRLPYVGSAVRLV